MRFPWNGFRFLAPALALVALAAGGCGGDDGDEADSTAEDQAAVKELLLDYAALVDEEACALWSEELLARRGGVQGCLKVIGDEGVTSIEVLDTEVEGDSGRVLVSVRPEDTRFVFPVVREGDSTDSYDGWRIASVDVERVEVDSLADATETTEETTETEASEETTTESTPQTPEEKQAAYRACIEGRGAKQVSQDAGDPPQVEFEGPEGPVFAWFPADETAAQRDLEEVQGSGVEFAEVSGTVLVWSLFQPAPDDLDTATACAAEVG